MFNLIFLDDMLASMSTNQKTKPIEIQSDPPHIKNSLKIPNDEAVLKKLAEMSSLLLNDEDMTNLDCKTGQIKRNTKSEKSPTTNSNNKQAFLNGRSLKMIENQLADNIIDFEESNRDNLNKFLLSHNIKDGNLVKTRHIDLRDNQIQNSSTKTMMFKKTNNPVEAFLAMKIENKSTKKPFRFLNETDATTSESSSSDEDDDNNILWIERYRKQKIELLKQKN